uniref:Uncharacterized protein n=1 Tax=Timema douglasi TaxID=61478 RepID=A0A7R8Z6Y6_TIMDO|nr:unnamed protein product [Timema douglasi]
MTGVYLRYSIPLIYLLDPSTTGRMQELDREDAKWTLAWVCLRHQKVELYCARDHTIGPLSVQAAWSTAACPTRVQSSDGKCRHVCLLNRVVMERFEPGTLLLVPSLRLTSYRSCKQVDNKAKKTICLVPILFQDIKARTRVYNNLHTKLLGSPTASLVLTNSSHLDHAATEVCNTVIARSPIHPPHLMERIASWVSGEMYKDYSRPVSCLGIVRWPTHEECRRNKWVSVELGPCGLQPDLPRLLCLCVPDHTAGRFVTLSRDWITDDGEIGVRIPFSCTELVIECLVRSGKPDRQRTNTWPEEHRDSQLLKVVGSNLATYFSPVHCEAASAHWANRARQYLTEPPRVGTPSEAARKCAFVRPRLASVQI